MITLTGLKGSRWFKKRKETTKEDLVETMKNQNDKITEICDTLDKLTDDLIKENRKLMKQAKELGLM